MTGAPSIRQARCLVTGASSGIGQSIAVALARHGAGAVALVARRADALAETARRVEELGARAQVRVADVSDTAQVEHAVHESEAALGGLDIVVANAGIGVSHGSYSIEDVVRLAQVNYVGAAATLLAALPGMLERGSGHLVGVTSLAGWRGLPVGIPYSASKAALEAFLEGLRVSLRPRGVRVTTVAPGFVDTPILQGKKRPFTVSAEEAGERIVRAIESGARTLAFPWQTALVMRLVRWIPDPIYDRVAVRLRK